jgi:hypothetical protein
VRVAVSSAGAAVTIRSVSPSPSVSANWYSNFSLPSSMRDSTKRGAPPPFPPASPGSPKQPGSANAMEWSSAALIRPSPPALR